MKKNLGLLMTGVLLLGAGLIAASTTIRNTEKEIENISNRIKKDREDVEKYSIRFE